MKKIRIVGLLNIVSVLLSLACASPTVTISRRDGPDTNRKSIFLTAGNKIEMTKAVVDKFKASDFYAKANAQNILKIKKGTIVNRTGETISTSTMMNDITDLFVDESINYVEFMNDTSTTLQTEREIEFQQQRGSIKSSPKVEYDYILRGALTLSRDQNLTAEDIRAEKINVEKTYQLSMEIINIRLNKIDWVGQHKVSTTRRTE